MHRRAALTLALAGTLAPRLVMANRRHGETLRAFIETVVADGDTSDLPALVTNDVTIPDMDVDGIDAFRAASDAGHISRAERYTEMTFDILSIAEADAWAHTLIQFTGTRNNGRTETQPLFYVARFDGDRIAELYLK